MHAETDRPTPPEPATWSDRLLLALLAAWVVAFWALIRALWPNLWPAS